MGLKGVQNALVSELRILSEKVLLGTVYLKIEHSDSNYDLLSLYYSILSIKFISYNRLRFFSNKLFISFHILSIVA